MTDEVLFTHEDNLGFITLNRPEALNALTLPMIQAIQNQLSLWQDDNQVHAIIIQALTDRVFCAGGDVRWLYNWGRSEGLEQMQFFWHEYRLNHFINQLTKPYIALMNGMTMGGGVGISLHGSYPVASEHFVFAMPETSIGFFPDIGASHLLTRCPGFLGIYLGLTGNRLGAGDALHAGLVKHIMAAEHFSLFVDALRHDDLSTDAHARVAHWLHIYAHSFANESSQIKPLIDECFSHPDIHSILAALRQSEGIWAESVDNTLKKKSPLSLTITLAQLQKAQGLSLAECLQMDFNLVRHFMEARDFYEGVRALLIDKDRKPQWNPASLDLVTENMVAAYFERSPQELELIVG